MRVIDALGWLEYALASGDSDAALTAMTATQHAMSSAENVRYAERIAALVGTALGLLERRVAAGDVRALAAVGASFRNGAREHDPVRYFAYLHAESLAANEGVWRPDPANVGRDLTPAQREEGTRIGRAIYASCCQGD